MVPFLIRTAWQRKPSLGPALQCLCAASASVQSPPARLLCSARTHHTTSKRFGEMSHYPMMRYTHVCKQQRISSHTQHKHRRSCLGQEHKALWRLLFAVHMTCPAMLASDGHPRELGGHTREVEKSSTAHIASHHQLAFMHGSWNPLSVQTSMPGDGVPT